jgi:hypothetical protein
MVRSEEACTALALHLRAFLKDNAVENLPRSSTNVTQRNSNIDVAELFQSWKSQNQHANSVGITRILLGDNHFSAMQATQLVEALGSVVYEVSFAQNYIGCTRSGEAHKPQLCSHDSQNVSAFAVSNAFQLFCNMIASVKSLRKLDLSRNCLSSKAIVALAMSLQANKSNLVELDLRENNIGLRGLHALVSFATVNTDICIIRIEDARLSKWALKKLTTILTRNWERRQVEIGQAGVIPASGLAIVPAKQAADNLTQEVSRARKHVQRVSVDLRNAELVISELHHKVGKMKSAHKKLKVVHKAVLVTLQDKTEQLATLQAAREAEEGIVTAVQGAIITLETFLETRGAVS